MGNCKSASLKRHGSRKVTLAILGLDNAGKTVTAKGLQGAPVSDVAPTIGFSSLNFQLGQHDITVFDLGGGRGIRGIWKKYLADVHGVIYVVDASDPHRLTECSTVITDLLSNELVQGKPLLVLANKQDVAGALDEAEICERLELEQLVNSHKCPCRVETCSATLRRGTKIDGSIQTGLSWLLAVIDNEWESLGARVESDVAAKLETEKREQRERAERIKTLRELRDKEEAEQRALRGEPAEDEVDGGDVPDNPFRPIDQQLQLVQERTKKNTNESNSNAKQLRRLSASRSEHDLSDANERNNLGAQKSSSEHALVKRSVLPSLSSRPALDGGMYDSADDSAKPKNGAAGYRRLPSPTVPNRLPGLTDSELSATKPRAPLMPLSPLSPLEPVDQEKVKKKKKRIFRSNQTSPVASTEMLERDASEPYGAQPSTPAKLLPPVTSRVSSSPRLGTVREPSMGESDNDNSSFATKWNLVDDLPDLPPQDSGRQRRNRPNTEDEDLVT